MKSTDTTLATSSQLFASGISSFDRANFLSVCSHQLVPIVNHFVYIIGISGYSFVARGGKPSKKVFQRKCQVCHILCISGYSLMPDIKGFLKIQCFFKYHIILQEMVTIHGRKQCQH